MLHVVIGPPAAGKSTYCRERAQPDDVIIDFDLIANALSAPRDGASKHEHGSAVKALTKVARQAAIEKALTITGVDVYLIHSTPSATLLARYRRAGAEIVTIDPGYAVVMERAKRERPWWMQGAIKKWYADRGVVDASPTEPRREPTQKEKGLGHEHRKNREYLLSRHVDGTACWWCGEPMYREAGRNHDGKPLHADHSTARAHGGTKADRLLHDLCNKRRGDGSRDHTRPTVAALAALMGPPSTPGTNALDW